MIGIAYLLVFFTVTNTMDSGPLALAVRVGLGVIGVLFFVGCIINFVRMGSKKPVAIINKDGIWINQFGLIPWHNISDIRSCCYRESPYSTLSIHVHDLKKLSSNAPFLGKCAVFWGKLFRYNPVIIGELALPTETIVEFAKQFMVKQGAL